MWPPADFDFLALTEGVDPDDEEALLGLLDNIRDAGGTEVRFSWVPRAYVDLGDFLVGVGDGMTFTLSRHGRSLTPWADAVDTGSKRYRFGGLAGLVTSAGATWKIVLPRLAHWWSVGRLTGPPLALVGKNAGKLAQQIRRWHEIGGVGNEKQFLQYAGQLAAEARAAGQVVTGTVGSSAAAIQNATVYRRGTEYLVVQGDTIMSYVSKASRSDGIVTEFIRLGGAP